MDDKNIFSERLKELLHSNDMTQTELSDSLGISSSMLSYYIRGIKQPSVNIIKLIAKKFNVSIDWLLGLEEPKDTELKTYADMIKLLIPLLKYPKVWTLVRTYEDMNDGFLYGSQDDEIPFDNLRTSNHIIMDFLDNYRKMTEILENNSIPEDLYNLWINDRLNHYNKIPLPPEKDEIVRATETSTD